MATRGMTHSSAQLAMSHKKSALPPKPSRAFEGPLLNSNRKCMSPAKATSIYILTIYHILNTAGHNLHTVNSRTLSQSRNSGRILHCGLERFTLWKIYDVIGNCSPTLQQKCSCKAGESLELQKSSCEAGLKLELSPEIWVSSIFAP